MKKTQRIVESFETYSALNEGTRSRIGLLQDDGTVKSVYIHWDGYWDGVGKDVQDLTSIQDIEDRLELGDSSTVFDGFYKDRGEENVDAIISSSLIDYLKDTEECWGEFAYIFDPRTNKWYGKEVLSKDDPFTWKDVTNGEEVRLRNRIE